MNYSDVYFQANEQLLLKNLVAIDEEHYEQVNKEYWDADYATLTFEEWKEVMASTGYDVKRIKRNANMNTMRQYFYEGEYLTVEINTLDPGWLSNEFTISCLKADDYGKNLFENKTYSLYFFSEQNLFAIDYFHRHYDKIAVEDRYEAFKSMYVHCNYGFNLFDKDLLDNVFSLADNQQAVQELKDNKKVKDGYLTIYRGMGERSTRLEDAYSWTLSRAVAERFAHHFGRGKVYQAKVDVNNILDYISDRNEEEIWVKFDALKELQLIDGTEE